MEHDAITTRFFRQNQFSKFSKDPSLRGQTLQGRFKASQGTQEEKQVGEGVETQEQDMIEKIQIHDSILYCADCMDVFEEIGKVDIVITDPPYGIGENNKKNLSRYKNDPQHCIDYGNENNLWDIKLDKKYIDKLLEISQHQIIFGGNYYADWLPASSGWIYWDKKTTGDFGDGELAYTSFKRAIRAISFQWSGFKQEDMKNKEKRVHLTQKPEYVMKWIVANYTKETDLVLDPFMGSGTTGVACAAGKRRFIGVEKEKRYFDIACKRIDYAYRQLTLF